MLIRRAAAALLMATFASTVAAQAPLATCGAQDACTSPAVCVTVGSAKTCYLPPTATCTVGAQDNCISGVCTTGDLTCAKSANTKPCRTAADCSATGATCTAGVCTPPNSSPETDAQTPAAGAVGGACLADKTCTAASSVCIAANNRNYCLTKYDQTCTIDFECLSQTCTGGKCAKAEPDEGCTVDGDCATGAICRKGTTAAYGACKTAGGFGQPCLTDAKCTSTDHKCDAATKTCGLKTKVDLGGTCVIDADCSAGVCVIDGEGPEGKCKKTIGQTCAAATDCATNLKCLDAAPKVCVRDTAGTGAPVEEFGLCAIDDDCATEFDFCERADAAKGIPGQCVKLRSLGVTCADDADCVTGKCDAPTVEKRNCTFDATKGLLSAAVTASSGAMAADVPKVVPLPLGAVLKLTPIRGGEVEATAEGKAPDGVDAPTGNAVPFFLTFTESSDLVFDTAELAFTYTEAVQQVANIPPQDVRWAWFDETAEEWKQCAEDNSEYDAETRVVTCKTEHFSTWTLAAKSAAFTAYVPHVVTVVAATVLSLSMCL
ncbi:hypothetical protein BC832DRAFT_59982 [Gaertneriomyces semiglobifer]|nr:hypothetical protein BC832DRAFT_59982 [Gaertneriomyces semiglobifer]